MGSGRTMELALRRSGRLRSRTWVGSGGIKVGSVGVDAKIYPRDQVCMRQVLLAQCTLPNCTKPKTPSAKSFPRFCLSNNTAACDSMTHFEGDPRFMSDFIDATMMNWFTTRSKGQGWDLNSLPYTTRVQNSTRKCHGS